MSDPCSVRALSSLIVLTGPSGVGKGTLLRSLLRRHPDLRVSVSATTRPPRPGEVEGREYYFMQRPQFEALIAQSELLEWAEYAGNYYGTPRQPVLAQVQQDHRVILEIELEGARQIRQTAPDALQVFVQPPSMAELERRIRDRGQDSEAAIARRLAQAEVEIAAAHEFDVQIVNNHFDTALQALEAALCAPFNGA